MEGNCHVEPANKVINAEDLNEAHIIVLEVLGMGCVNCATRVRNALLALDSVVSADVDWESGLAFVDHIPSKTSVDALVRAVAAASDDERHNYHAQVISQKEIT